MLSPGAESIGCREIEIDHEEVWPVVCKNNSRLEYFFELFSVLGNRFSWWAQAINKLVLSTGTERAQGKPEFPVGSGSREPGVSKRQAGARVVVMQKA